MRDIRLAGKLEGQLTWQTESGNGLQATGHVVGQEVRVAYGPRVNLEEPHFRLDLSARGETNPTGLRQVTSAEISLLAGDDRLHCLLTEPIDTTLTNERWPVRLQINGRLESWSRRAQALTSVGLPPLAGNLTADLELLADSGTLSIPASQIKLEPIQLLTTQQQELWSEPFAELRFRGRYLPQQDQVEVDTLVHEQPATRGNLCRFFGRALDEATRESERPSALRSTTTVGPPAPAVG